MSKKRIIRIIVVTMAALTATIIFKIMVPIQLVGTILEPTSTQLYKVVLPILVVAP